jgi:hypothetical protein
VSLAFTSFGFFDDDTDTNIIPAMQTDNKEELPPCGQQFIPLMSIEIPEK